MPFLNHGTAAANKLIFIAAAIALFIIFAVGGYWGPQWADDLRDSRARAAFRPPAVPKRQLSEFSRDFASVLAATEPKYLPDAPLDRPDGSRMSLGTLRGRPALVNFWATWCGPCVVELPSLARMKARYDGRIDVLAISFEPRKDAAGLAAFLDRRGVGDFAAYHDGGNAFPAALDLAGIPTSFLIGSDGQILYRFEGDADWDSPAARAFFDVFLLQQR